MHSVVCIGLRDDCSRVKHVKFVKIESRNFQLWDFDLWRILRYVLLKCFTFRSSFNLDCGRCSSELSSNVIAVTKNLSFIKEAETSGGIKFELEDDGLSPNVSSLNCDW